VISFYDLSILIGNVSIVRYCGNRRQTADRARTRNVSKSLNTHTAAGGFYSPILFCCVSKNPQLPSCYW